MANRKLGKPTDQRVAMLRNLTTALIWNGKIVTTETRAKEVRSIAEKIITLAVKEYKNTDMVEKEVYNEKGQVSKEEKPQDQETKKEYRERTKGTNHAVVEKLFRELAPKYDGRIQEGKKGGYTRMYKLGVRRGDAAPMVVLELV